MDFYDLVPEIEDVIIHVTFISYNAHHPKKLSLKSTIHYRFGETTVHFHVYVGMAT